MEEHKREVMLLQNSLRIYGNSKYKYYNVCKIYVGRNNYPLKNNLIFETFKTKKSHWLWKQGHLEIILWIMIDFFKKRKNFKIILP